MELSHYESGDPIAELRKDFQVRNNQMLTFKLLVLDKDRRAFHNFSTFNVEAKSIAKVTYITVSLVARDFFLPCKAYLGLCTPSPALLGLFVSRLLS